MSAAVTFLIALALLVAFVVFRFWEEKRGVRLFAEKRAAADTVVAEMYRAAVMGNIPAEYRIAVIRFLHTLAHDTVVFLVEGLRAVERPLTRLSYRMRQSAPASNGKEPSAFLKTITPEKPANGADAKTTDSI
ncbi:MAG: hypothetical protein Q7R74_01960 [bacterium]|nr:hypothetical protein [bacterium]